MRGVAKETASLRPRGAPTQECYGRQGTCLYLSVQGSHLCLLILIITTWSLLINAHWGVICTNIFMVQLRRSRSRSSNNKRLKGREGKSPILGPPPSPVSLDRITASSLEGETNTLLPPLCLTICPASSSSSPLFPGKYSCGS